jgi:hypothetical protein
MAGLTGQMGPVECGRRVKPTSPPEWRAAFSWPCLGSGRVAAGAMGRGASPATSVLSWSGGAGLYSEPHLTTSKPLANSTNPIFPHRPTSYCMYAESWKPTGTTSMSCTRFCHISHTFWKISENVWKISQTLVTFRHLKNNFFQHLHNFVAFSGNCRLFCCIFSFVMIYKLSRTFLAQFFFMQNGQALFTTLPVWRDVCALHIPLREPKGSSGSDKCFVITPRGCPNF